MRHTQQCGEWMSTWNEFMLGEWTQSYSLFCDYFRVFIFIFCFHSHIALFLAMSVYSVLCSTYMIVYIVYTEWAANVLCSHIWLWLYVYTYVCSDVDDSNGTEEMKWKEWTNKTTIMSFGWQTVEKCSCRTRMHLVWV